MRWKTWAPSLALMLLLVPAVAARDGDGLVLARVDGEPITLGRLRADFEERHQRHLRMLGGEDVIRDFLNAQIERQLFVDEAYRLGLDEDPRIVELVEAQRVRLAGEWLYESEVNDRVKITDGMIDEALDRSRTVVEIVRVQCDSRDAAVAARKRVLDGEPADSVARELSTARSKTRGGLELLAWGRAEPELERVVLAAAEGDVTPVVEVESGWVFARLIKVETIAPEDYREDRSWARERLRFRGKAERRDAYLNDLRERYGAKAYPERVSPDLLTPLLDAEASEIEDPTPVAELEGEVITRGEFLQSIRPRAYLALTPGQRERQARFLLENRIDELVLKREGRRRWNEAPDAVKDQVRAVRDDLLFRIVLSDYVFEGLTAEDEEIESWYRERLDRYVEPVSILLAIALLETEEGANQFLEDLHGGGSFEDLARERSLDAQTARSGGLAGWVSRDQAIAELREAPFETPVGETGGPVELTDGWIVFRVVDRKESRQLPLDEARDRVRSELMQDKSAKRQQRWSEKLRDASEVTVYDRAIRKAARLLERESEDVLEVPAMPSGHGAPDAGTGHP